MDLGGNYWLEVSTHPEDTSCHRAKLFKGGILLNAWTIEKLADREVAKRVALRHAKDYLENRIAGVQDALNGIDKILRSIL